MEIVVVNDGSTDNTAQLAKSAGVRVISHMVNRGVGAATKTGIEYAASKKADIVITIDADGQHNPSDIEKVIKPIRSRRADVVIGSRLIKMQKMPADRFIINWFANMVTFFLFGVFSTDSQSGLRAFSKKALRVIDIKSDRMEFSSEVLLEAQRNKLRVREVPIQAIYTPYSRTKGQRNLNAIPILFRFIVKMLR